MNGFAWLATALMLSQAWPSRALLFDCGSFLERVAKLTTLSVPELEAMVAESGECRRVSCSSPVKLNYPETRTYLSHEHGRSG